MILCIGPTPATQRVMVFPKLVLEAVNRAAQTAEGIAGKSVNVAKVLCSLGEKVVATGFAGGDRGAHLLALLKGRGVDADFVNVAAPTRQCTTVIDQTAGTVTELVEESQPVPARAYDDLKSIIQRRTVDAAAVVMSGTITPGGPTDFYRWCTEVAVEAGALPVVDAQGTALIEALRARPGLVKPNRAELSATVGRQLKDQAELFSAMRELCDRGAGRIVVTAGKDPILAFDGRNAWSVSSPRITPLNPIGSGDAFTAALVWRLVGGDELGEACRWGAAVGAANALTLMAGEIDLADLNRLAREVSVERLDTL
jgi:tagatose 6-phosphate kinase